MSSPYPRTYYKGRYSREEDERLAKELFFGTSTIDKKPGRERHDYLPADSPEERRAFEAFQRLVTFCCEDLDDGILGGLIASLNPDGIFPRRLVFKQRDRKKKAGYPTDLQIALYVHDLGPDAKKVAEQVVAHFGLKATYAKKFVHDALNRIQDKDPWLLEEWPWENEVNDDLDERDGQARSGPRSFRKTPRRSA
jgi:hypothetical protein